MFLMWDIIGSNKREPLGILTLCQEGPFFCGGNMKENRVGFTNKTKIGEEYKVVEYNGCNDVIIEFPNGDRKKTT